MKIFKTNKTNKTDKINQDLVDQICKNWYSTKLNNFILDLKEHGIEFKKKQ